MPSRHYIPSRKIPGQSALYAGYVEGRRPALAFYRHPPRLGVLARAAPQIAARFELPRDQVCGILRRQNASFGRSPETLANIEALANPDCVAVLTGQQVGLFTGPLYTIYKAMTALQLAAELRARNVPAVAVFWMESEDHDLEEVTRVTTLDNDSRLHAHDFREALFGPERKAAQSVGSLRFPESITEVVMMYCNYFAGHPWSDWVRLQLEGTYRPGSGFSGSFGRLMTQLFGPRGLILFDPRDPEAKDLVSKTFQKAISDADVIHRHLLERNEALGGAGFHVQVRVPEGATLLFFHRDGSRSALTRQNSSFAPKNSNRNYSCQEMLSIAEGSPERFSPNVLLRPIVQDSLFPTIAYVAGPSEVAYFAQAEVLYRLFGRPMPAIWPRGSFTILDSEASGVLGKNGLRPQDCFEGKEAVLRKVGGGPDPSGADAALESLHEHMDQALDELRKNIVDMEPTLGPALDNARRKMLHHVSRLRSRHVKMQERGNAPLFEKIGALLNQCYPGDNPQERVLGIHYFTARHGPALLDTLFSLLDVERFEHCIIELD